MVGSFLSKAINWINKFFKTMGSPLSGFNMNDIQVKNTGDQFSELFQFTSGELSTISGKPIDLNVLLVATNAREVFSPILTALNNITDEQKMLLESDRPGKSPLLDVLLGADRTDNRLSTAQANGTGLLGATLKVGDSYVASDGASFDGKHWSWKEIGDEYLTYSIECEAVGYDYGALENIKLPKCSASISEYLVKVNVIDNADEVKVDPNLITFPILKTIQEWLTQYYIDACKKYANTDAETLNEKNGAEAEQMDEVADQIDNAFTETQTASRHIDITLQKIAGTTSFNMTMIKANYDPTQVLSDVDEIIGRPEFMDALPEDLTTYSIDVADDTFDIEECAECVECAPCEGLCEVFKAGIRAYRNLYILHWMSSGNDMMKLHNLSEEMYGELQGEIDTIGELLVEKQGTVPQLDFPCDYIPVQQYDFQAGLDQIKSLISMYIDCIDYAYCNQDSDVQSTLDEWLRYWKKQLNYFVKGQEI